MSTLSQKRRQERLNKATKKALENALTLSAIVISCAALYIIPFLVCSLSEVCITANA